MKNVLLICLLAGCGPCFAQNLNLKDLQQILETPTVESANQLLKPRGYLLSNKTGSLVWGFRSEMNADAANVAQLYKATDTLGTKLVYETTNPFFYTNLLNQLPANNFSYKKSTTGDNLINLVFSNGRLELLVDLANENPSGKPYRITLQPVNPLQKLLPPQYNQQYNHKIRVNPN